MKQPKIKIFGKVYSVKQIEYDREGTIVKVIYFVGSSSKTVFKKDEMIGKSLSTSHKITEPTWHPYYDYAYAPNLESLLLCENDKFQCEECGKRFAVEQFPGEIIDEPICPVCTSDNVRDAE